MSNSVKFISGKKKTRGELRLPQLHFVVLDDWQHKIGKEAIWAWLQFYSWADRSQADREADMIPNSMGKIQKKLGVGKDTFYNKIIRPLWNHGFIDLQEINTNGQTGHNPVNIIVYEYPQNDPDRATKPLEQVRDYNKDYQTATRKSAQKGGRPKKNNAPSSDRELPHSSDRELPLVPTENYPSSHTEPNNVLNQSNVLNDFNETNISQSVKKSKVENEALQLAISKSKKLTDRLTDIEHTYLAVKGEKGYSDALFIATLQKAAVAKIRVPFGQYLLKAMINNLKEQASTGDPYPAKKNDLPEYVVNQANHEDDPGEELDPEQKREVDELLRQLGEIE